MVKQTDFIVLSPNSLLKLNKFPKKPKFHLIKTIKDTERDLYPILTKFILYFKGRTKILPFISSGCIFRNINL